MTLVPYIACVITAACALLWAISACIDNDGGGDAGERGNTGLLLLRLIAAASVLVCAWRAWP